jgi:hypothetical protein
MGPNPIAQKCGPGYMYPDLEQSDWLGTGTRLDSSYSPRFLDPQPKRVQVPEPKSVSPAFLSHSWAVKMYL